jgi:diguanylate cyclase (GGDEF)-like protein/PAS domain S-box-containing protein
MFAVKPGKDVVLLVDDEPQVLVALEDILADEFTVIKAESGVHALNVAEQEPRLAVVVTDQRMPRMSGDELLSQLAARTAASRIMVTGYADLGAVVRAVNEGRLFAYVSKPWEPDDLRLKVSQAAEHYRLSAELAEERQLLHDLMDNIPDGIYFKDLDLRFRRVNRAFSALYGTAADQLLNKRWDELEELGLDAATEREDRAVLAEGKSLTDTMRQLRFQGRPLWLSESKAAVRTGNGSTIGLVGIVRDITERKAEDERVAMLASLRQVASLVNGAIRRIQDSDALLEETCRLLTTTGGLCAGVVLKTNSEDLSSLWAFSSRGGELTSEYAERLEAWASANWRQMQSQGNTSLAIDELQAPGQQLESMSEPEIRSMGMLSFSVHDAMWILALGAESPRFFADERMKALLEIQGSVSLALDHIGRQRQVEFLSYNDPLTSLPNRRLLVARVNQQLSVHQRSNLKLALLLVDLGRFRQINDALGRAGGDQVLVEMGRRLRSLNKIGMVARFDGNVFALVYPAMEGEAAVAALADDGLRLACERPLLVDGTEVRVSVTTGIAVFPSDGDTADDLISRAETALKKAKAALLPYLFYAPTMNERVSERLALETKLRRAIVQNEFLLYYQPKVELRTGDIVGLEALIRWQDPEKGLVPPGHFIPVLEETGLIREVGYWVFERAASQFREWSTAGVVAPRIAVNVSALQLGAMDFVPRLERMLEADPMGGAGIDLEITESVFVEDLAGSTAKLEAARAYGMSVSIDDFGTGYSSLSYLSRLPIDCLKIDRSFISHMVDDPQSAAIVTTIISLAHALELKVIAEGVETRQQAQFLRLLRCSQMQGYLVSKPLPAAQIPELLLKRFTPSTLPPG